MNEQRAVNDSEGLSPQKRRAKAKREAAAKVMADEKMRETLYWKGEDEWYRRESKSEKVSFEYTCMDYGATASSPSTLA